MTTVEQPVRTRASAQRVRIAKEALLGGEASAIVDSIRNIICEPTRTQIVRALTPGPLSVGEIAAILSRSKSATSQHLRVLRDAGIVRARRRGRVVIYSLSAEPIVDATVQVLDRAAALSAA